MTGLHCYRRDAGQAVAADDHGDGHQLPSDVLVLQELQGALQRGSLKGCLLDQHFVHFLSVLTVTPECLKSCETTDMQNTQLGTLTRTGSNTPIIRYRYEFEVMCNTLTDQ